MPFFMDPNGAEVEEDVIVGRGLAVGGVGGGASQTDSKVGLDFRPPPPPPLLPGVLLP